MEHDDSPLSGEDNFEDAPQVSQQSPRKLPDDLPKSLDDRRSFPSYAGETEMYDAWQGKLLVYDSLRDGPPVVNGINDILSEQGLLSILLHPWLQNRLPLTSTSILPPTIMTRHMPD